MICKKCLIDKELSEFYRHPGTKEGVIHFCKDCKREYARANRSKEADKKRYWSNPKRRLNVIYRGMMSRCYNKNNSHYKRYGGKGIKVLRKNYKDFYNDMVLTYIDHWDNNGRTNNRQTQIDRIDVNDDYSKKNCRWITAQEQSNNTSSNYIIEYKGEKDTLSNICRKYNCSYKLVHQRISKGWNIANAIEYEKINKGYKHI